MAKLAQALAQALKPLLHILNGALPFPIVKDAEAAGADNYAGTLATALLAGAYLLAQHFQPTWTGPLLSVGVPALTILLHQWGRPTPAQG